MIVDYKLNSKHIPSERDVWLMSRRAELDGKVITLSLLKVMETGEVKYADGVFYRLCRHCMDYLPLESFYANKRYALGISYVCKPCTSTRKRIKSYAVPSYVSDVGMRDVPHGINFNLNEDSKRVILARIKEELTIKNHKGGE